FFSSRRRHTRSYGDWSSDVCSSDLERQAPDVEEVAERVDPLHRRLDVDDAALIVRVQPREARAADDEAVLDLERRPDADARGHRSEERRVGKECRCRVTEEQ